MKRHTIRIVEINVYRSKKNPRIGHAVANLFPCEHNKYLGVTLYKGPVDSSDYRTNDCRIIKFEDYSVTDKETCKLCPPDDYWLDDLNESISLDEFVGILEVLDVD